MERLLKTFKSDEFMMSKKQRGGLHYDMNKGTNFRGGDEKVDKLLVIVLPLKRVKVFVESTSV